MHKKGLYEKLLKRLFDFISALIALVILLPLLLLVAILVRLKLRSPIIFKQQRPGLNEKIFTLYKFRTMKDLRNANGALLSDGERLTKFGKLLRSSSLDELPSLWNIIKGDLSLVGPRPQLIKDLLFMSEKESKRHSVKPGLTGLAQVSGRNNVTWEEKFFYDLKYIQKITFLTDIKIIILTFWKVIIRKDTNTIGMDTAENYGDYLLRNNIITKDEYDKIMLKENLIIGDKSE